MISRNPQVLFTFDERFAFDELNLFSSNCYHVHGGIHVLWIMRLKVCCCVLLL